MISPYRVTDEARRISMDPRISGIHEPRDEDQPAHLVPDTFAASADERRLWQESRALVLWQMARQDSGVFARMFQRFYHEDQGVLEAFARVLKERS